MNNLFFVNLVYKITPFFLMVWSAQALCAESNPGSSLAEPFRLNGITTQDAFGQGKAKALNATVRLLRNNKLIALGTLINPRGYVITKASSCVGARKATLQNGSSFSLKIRKRFEEIDLALYELIADENTFACVEWVDNNLTLPASWVFSSFIELEEIRIGLASGNPRTIGREGGVMGVMLGHDGKKLGGVEINEVVPQAAGDRAGLLAKDLILSIDGRRVFTKEQLGKVVSSKDPGDMINLEVSRKNKKRKIKVTLGHSSVTFELFNRNLQMSGPVSKRKDNFPLILQHDLPLPKEGMGGPLFNLEGKCIGINIARVDRVTTFALPTKILLPYLKDWLPNRQSILPERITKNDTKADL